MRSRNSGVILSASGMMVKSNAPMILPSIYPVPPTITMMRMVVRRYIEKISGEMNLT